MFSQMYSDGSQFLLGLLCSFHVTFALRLVSKIWHHTDKQNPRQNIWNKIVKSNETGHEQKSFISAFSSFLTTIASLIS